MMKLRMVGAMVVMVLALSALASAQTVVEPKGDVPYPVSARIELPEAKPAAGTQPTVRVKVRNTVTEAGRHGVAMILMAVVLRGVRWSDQPTSDDGKKWLAPKHGSTRKNRDGTVAHNTVAQRMTDLAFENGLLLPGEAITVELPAPSSGTQAGETATLSVTYAIVPGNFESQILLAEPISPKGTGELTVKYLPYSEATAEAHRRVRGVALVKATMDRRAKPLPVREQKLEFALPAAR